MSAGGRWALDCRVLRGQAELGEGELPDPGRRLLPPRLPSPLRSSFLSHLLLRSLLSPPFLAGGGRGGDPGQRATGVLAGRVRSARRAARRGDRRPRPRANLAAPLNRVRIAVSSCEFFFLCGPCISACAPRSMPWGRGHSSGLQR